MNVYVEGRDFRTLVITDGIDRHEIDLGSDYQDELITSLLNTSWSLCKDEDDWKERLVNEVDMEDLLETYLDSECDADGVKGVMDIVAGHLTQSQLDEWLQDSI